MRNSRMLIGLLPFLWALMALSGAHLEDDDMNEAEETGVSESNKNFVQQIMIKCNPDDMTVTISTNLGEEFNGLIYPQGLSKHSACMTEYVNSESTVDFVIPLRSCNTMSTDVDKNEVEYFNTIVVQPHRKLVTHQGRGYHIRCRYRTHDTQNLLSNFNVSGLNTMSPSLATAAMPGTYMKIYYGDAGEGQVAESVKIGDLLTLVVSIDDDQDVYGMRVTDCVVRDGLGWSEQKLIDSNGCPTNPAEEIMGAFDYSTTKTTALTSFQAHKFPHAPSVYYQCNVRLCIRHAGGCEDTPPASCPNGISSFDDDGGGGAVNLWRRHRQNRYRSKRQIRQQDETKGPLYDTDREDLKVKVYSGLYVSEADDLDDGFFDDHERQSDDIPNAKRYDSSFICIPQRDFAIGIAIAGLFLVVVVIIAILILLTKRRRRKDLSTTGSSIYSGPYTNTAFSYSS